MYRVTRRFEFDAGHRLLDYEGDCSRLHGHHYFVEVTLQGLSLDKLGMLVDFGTIKKIVKPLLDKWDHRTIVNPNDPLIGVILFQHLVVMDVDGNPTAERMAMELFHRISRELEALLFDGVGLYSVKVYETPGCCAEYTADE